MRRYLALASLARLLSVAGGWCLRGAGVAFPLSERRLTARRRCRGCVGGGEPASSSRGLVYIPDPSGWVLCPVRGRGSSVLLVVSMRRRHLLACYHTCASTAMNVLHGCTART